MSRITCHRSLVCHGVGAAVIWARFRPVDDDPISFRTPNRRDGGHGACTAAARDPLWRQRNLQILQTTGGAGVVVHGNSLGVYATKSLSDRSHSRSDDVAWTLAWISTGRPSPIVATSEICGNESRTFIHMVGLI